MNYQLWYVNKINEKCAKIYYKSIEKQIKCSTSETIIEANNIKIHYEVIEKE